MKSAFSYICSLVISVLLVFSFIAAAASLTANINIKESRFHELVSENELSTKTRSQLEKYFTSKYNSTGIPAETYMSAIDEAYISDIINEYIDNGFYALRTGTDPSEPVTANVKNCKLEDSINQFFIESADDSNTKMDGKFDEKLENTKQKAYSIISEYCDVYKFGALQKHGVLRKLSPIYRRLDLIVIASTAASAVLMLLLLIINIRFKPAAMYWTGVSALIAGIISAAPTGYLLATDYFKRFTIKQPQVYSAYTSAMTLYTKSFLSAAICLAAVGICFMIVYRTVAKTAEEK